MKTLLVSLFIMMASIGYADDEDYYPRFDNRTILLPDNSIRTYRYGSTETTYEPLAHRTTIKKHHYDNRGTETIVIQGDPYDRY